ncbi:hypothetical protein D9M68_960530 [compost metagenome]
MERRLYRGITTPAMIATWVFGLWMIHLGMVDWGAGWPYLKAACVIALSGVHGMLGGYLRAFKEDRNTKPQKFFRLINEVPTVLMVVIVIAVIAKPF